MRWLCSWVFALLLSLAAVGAQPSHLEGGVFIAHQVPGLAFSSDWMGGDPCAAYAPYAIDSCDAQANRVDPAGATRVTWFVLAAWCEAKVWCGAEFGLGDYDPALFAFDQHGPCFPTSGLTIPSAGWPGPNSGIAMAVTGASWSGNYVPVYFFSGYAYSEPGPGVIPLAENPATRFAGTANCLTPPVPSPAVALGGLGIGTDGIFACPPSVPPLPGCCWIGGECFITYEHDCLQMGGIYVPPPYCDNAVRRCGSSGPPRVCCLGSECVLMVEPQCADAGGVFHSEWENCDSDPCVARRVCCVCETCQVLTQDECAALDGLWHTGWHSCGPPNPCAEPRVCCIGETCRLIADPDACADLQGVWHPEWTSCAGNPCDGLPPQGACCTGETCIVTGEEDCDSWGGIWLVDWGCDPNNCFYLPPPPHACCVGEQCLLVENGGECAAAGGVLHPWVPDCDPNQCATPTPGCCWIGEICMVVLDFECMAMGGVWVPPDYCLARGRDCGSGPPRTCCIDHVCYVLAERQCLDAGGQWLPEAPPCDSQPCGGGVPAQRRSWGAIKALYR